MAESSKTAEKKAASSEQKVKTPTSSEASPNIDTIIQAIEKLTVLELSKLVKALEEKFGVTAQAPVVTAQTVATAGSATEEKAEEKTEFDAVLTSIGDKKIQVIKVVRAITGLGLREAKELVDNTPKPVKEGVLKEEAEDIKKKLEEVGATVEVK